MQKVTIKFEWITLGTTLYFLLPEKLYIEISILIFALTWRHSLKGPLFECLIYVRLKSAGFSALMPQWSTPWGLCRFKGRQLFIRLSRTVNELDLSQFICANPTDRISAFFPSQFSNVWPDIRATSTASHLGNNYCLNKKKVQQFCSHS